MTAVWNTTISLQAASLIRLSWQQWDKRTSVVRGKSYLSENYRQDSAEAPHTKGLWSCKLPFCQCTVRQAELWCREIDPWFCFTDPYGFIAVRGRTPKWSRINGLLTSELLMTIACLMCVTWCVTQYDSCESIVVVESSLIHYYLVMPYDINIYNCVLLDIGPASGWLLDSRSSIRSSGIIGLRTI